MKIGCVIQGDIRRGSEIVLRDIPKLFDYTVLSTWKDDEAKIPTGTFAIILNDPPKEAGLSHRNYQRFSTARGLEAARDAGCDYVLKWRTDMLPTNLDVKKLIEWAEYSVLPGVTSRIVMPAFRNLTVEPDWFSSIPDLFSFGHIDMMEMLWGDDGFDYNESMNIPKMMRKDLNLNSELINNISELYCAETELYALLKQRLQMKLGHQLSHVDLCKSYLRLFDERQMKIFWFGARGGFRSIQKAWEHPWWTEKIWEHQEPKILPCGYPVQGRINHMKALLSPARVRLDETLQAMRWKLFYSKLFCNVSNTDN